MKKSLLALAVLGTLVGCGNDRSSDIAPVSATPQFTAPAAPTPATTAPAAPVVVQQSSGGDSGGVGDLLTGAALGYMAGNMLNGGGSRPQYAPETRVIERRTVVNNYIERPPSVKAPKTTTPAPTTSPAAAPTKPSYGAAYAQAKPSPAAKPSYGSAYAAAKPAPAPSNSSSFTSSYSSSRSFSSSSPSRSSFTNGRR